MANDVVFRLRINFQKLDRMRLLSHLELVRTMERIIRRAQLPYVVSQGFNTHMRHAPGPALPVGTGSLDEYFDVWLSEYLRPKEACVRLQAASVTGINILGTAYVSPALKGLQATHTCEEYEVILAVEESSRDKLLEGGAQAPKCDKLLEGGAQAPSAVQAPNDAQAPNAAQLENTLHNFIKTGELMVRRQKKSKTYDLTIAVAALPIVRNVPEANAVALHLQLRSADQGAIKPELLIMAALGDSSPWQVKSITRTKLYEETARA